MVTKKPKARPRAARSRRAQRCSGRLVCEGFQSAQRVWSIRRSHCGQDFHGIGGDYLGGRRSAPCLGRAPSFFEGSLRASRRGNRPRTTSSRRGLLRAEDADHCRQADDNRPIRRCNIGCRRAEALVQAARGRRDIGRCGGCSICEPGDEGSGAMIGTLRRAFSTEGDGFEGAISEAAIFVSSRDGGADCSWSPSRSALLVLLVRSSRHLRL